LELVLSGGLQLLKGRKLTIAIGNIVLVSTSGWKKPERLGFPYVRNYGIKIPK
jgi:hypothetical protein